MITPDAFNALLKTLEEPPLSVIFILATTNLEKIPKTIVSRCLLVNFGKAKKADVHNMLSRIIEKENITIDKKLLELICRHSDHSFRDAAKMLEELVIQNKLTLETGQKFLGILAKKNLLEVMQSENLKQTLLWIEEFSQAGGSIKHLLEQLLEDLQRLLLAKNDIQIDQEVTVDLRLSEISLLIRLFSEAYNTLKISPIESLPLEIAVVDFYNRSRES